MTDAPNREARSRLHPRRLWAAVSRRPKNGWQLVIPLVFGAAGFLFATSAGAADGYDLRPADPVSLSGLVREQRGEVNALHAQVAQLQSDIESMTSQVEDTTLNRLEQRAEELRGPAGLEDVSGPGLRVTLDDAPVDQLIPEGVDPNDVVVHQQDLRAVVDALWSGGAEAISLQGQRLISTTGIKCVGNTVVLEGVPYSPPYVFEAVGPASGMLQALGNSDYLQRQYIPYTRPPVNLTWDVDVLDNLTVQAYDGPLDFNHAEIPARAE